MQLGPYNIFQPLILAPMEDVTDLPFRLVCKSLGADILVTEFTAAEAIIRKIPKSFKKISVHPDERPVGIQLFGSRPEALKEAASLVEQFRPDFIDINCGCWVKNHVTRLEGAGLLKDLKLFESIVKATVSGTTLPVTVKTRLGWDEKSIVILDVAKMVEQAGAKMLTVHCRTRSQAHRGFADWSWLEKIKQSISIPLIGNGDINSPKDVKMMLDTGCDGVMIGRGAVANPWIFQQSKHYLKANSYINDPTIIERVNLCKKHLIQSCLYAPHRKTVLSFRKYYVGYLKGIPGISKLRSELMKVETEKEVLTILDSFLSEICT